MVSYSGVGIALCESAVVREYPCYILGPGAVPALRARAGARRRGGGEAGRRDEADRGHTGVYYHHYYYPYYHDYYSHCYYIYIYTIIYIYIYIYIYT